MRFQDSLKALEVCPKAVDWVGDRTARQAWDECERADWMLWYAAELGSDRRLIVRANCACARRALRFVPIEDCRPLRAIETAEAWCDGKATLAEVRYASAKADEAAVCDKPAAAITAATEAATAAATACEASGAAASFAAGAIAILPLELVRRYRVSPTDADAAYTAQRKAELKIMADLVRSIIPFPGEPK
jgi:hypothetical protein